MLHEASSIFIRDRVYLEISLKKNIFLQFKTIDIYYSQQTTSMIVEHDIIWDTYKLIYMNKPHV